MKLYFEGIRNIKDYQDKVYDMIDAMDIPMGYDVDFFVSNKRPEGYLFIHLYFEKGDPEGLDVLYKVADRISKKFKSLQVDIVKDLNNLEVYKR